MNVQVIGDRWGRLLDVSDPTPGSMHDARSFATGLAALLPAGPCWPILALWGVGCRRRCVNPLVGSCASWRRSPTAPMPAFARWWSGPSRCSSSGRYWGWGIVGRWPGSQGDPDGGRVGKVPDLRKPILNNALCLTARGGRELGCRRYGHCRWRGDDRGWGGRGASLVGLVPAAAGDGDTRHQKDRGNSSDGAHHGHPL